MKRRAHRSRFLWMAFVVAGVMTLVLGGMAFAAPDPPTCECPSTPGAVTKAFNLGIPFLAAVSGDLSLTADPPDLSGCDGIPFDSLQGAVNAADSNVVIGVYVGRNPAKPAYHLPFRENVVIEAAGVDLWIVECVNPKIAADNPDLPVITIRGTAGDGIKGGTNDSQQPGERDIEILGVNVYNSDGAGIKIEEGVDGRVLLKGVRAENNGVGILVLGDNNEVRGSNGLKFNGVGLEVGAGASGNIIKSNRAQENVGDGIWVVGDNNDLNGNNSNNNGGIGYNIDGTGNKLKSNKASGNAVLQFDIEASNIDRGGNQANGATISFGSGGGEF